MAYFDIFAFSKRIVSGLFRSINFNSSPEDEIAATQALHLILTTLVSYLDVTVPEILYGICICARAMICPKIQFRLSAFPLLFLTSMYISCKYLRDRRVVSFASYFSEAGLTTTLLTDSESFLLSSLGFRVYVSPEEFRTTGRSYGVDEAFLK